jgi:hypothetical protein
LEEVLQQSIDSKIYLNFQYGLTQKENIFLMPSEVSVENNVIKTLFETFQRAPKKFVELSSFNSHVEGIPKETLPEDRHYMSFYLRLDNRSRTYSRHYSSILDFLGNVGGFFEIVSFVGFLLTAPFVARSMNAAMVE